MTVTRRNVIAAFGTVGAAGLLTSTSRAQAAGDGGGFDDPQPSGSGDVFSAQVTLTPGLSYLPIDPTAFGPVSSVDGRVISVGGGAGLVAPSGGLMTPIVLPVGTTLKEVTLAYLAPTATGANLSVWKKSLVGPYTLLAGPLPLAAGAAAQTATLAVSDLVDGQSTYMALMNIGTAAQRVHGLAVGYSVPPSSFVPISPVNRVLDTRGSTKLGVNEERTIVLGTPASASAAVINLTITNTEGAGGFVAVFRADVPWPGNSSINWSSAGQDVANGVVTATDATGAIKIRAGGNRTDVVIDVQGYLT